MAMYSLTIGENSLLIICSSTSAITPLKDSCSCLVDPFQEGFKYLEKNCSKPSREISTTCGPKGLFARTQHKFMVISKARAL